MHDSDRLSSTPTSSSAPFRYRFLSARQAVDKALDHGVLLFSDATMTELAEVLTRSKFDQYSAVKERVLFLGQLRSAAQFVHITQLVRACRDPRDDKFLEVALNGRADLIITGDADLLALHPWREIAILTPAEYSQH